MIIDCDSHFTPSDAFDYVSEDLRHLAPKHIYNDDGLLVDIQFAGKPPQVPGSTPLPPTVPTAGYALKGSVDMDARLADYSRLGIDQHVFLPQTASMWSYLIEPRLGAAMAHSWNLSVQRLMREYPGKLIGVALVALQAPDAAIEEITWARQNGFSAAVLDFVYPQADHPYGGTPGNRRELWPFFKKAEELEMPLYLHPFQHGHRLLNVMNFQADGLDLFAPSDAEMSVASYILSGLLDVCPNLKLIVAETGTGGIQPLAERMDREFEHITVKYEDELGFTRISRRTKAILGFPQTVEPEVAKEKNKKRPSDYFRNNFYWTIETEEPEFPDAIDFVGAEHFLFATDYPHDDPGGRMKYKDVQLLEANKRISEFDKELILYRNAVKLFHL